MKQLKKAVAILKLTQVISTVAITILEDETVQELTTKFIKRVEEINKPYQEEMDKYAAEFYDKEESNDSEPSEKEDI